MIIIIVIGPIRIEQTFSICTFKELRENNIFNNTGFLAKWKIKE
jgi:hypothetical protein